MTLAMLASEPVVLVDVDDLAEADLGADLAERLELDGRVFLPSETAGTPADVVSLACTIRHGGAAVLSAHGLGLEAAMLGLTSGTERRVH